VTALGIEQFAQPANESPAPTTEPTTRERLVAAAIEVFLEQGYERARVQDIARAAGLTTGAIYANYRDKSELLLAAIAGKSAAEVETLLQATGSRPRDVFAELGSRMAFREHERPLLIEAAVASQRDPELAVLLRDKLGDRHAQFAALIERGKTDDMIDPSLDTDSLTRFCLTLALGSLVIRTLELPQPEPDNWGALIERLLDALAPSEGGKSGSPKPEETT
jgi:AcrR family transcriptional regulator